MKENKIFLETITQYIGETITDISQVGPFETDGSELERICEDYYTAKLEQSGLRHFYNGKKYEYIALGFAIAAILMTILFYFLIQPL
jgi:hypothetical protein